MEVFALLTLITIAVAEFSYDLAHVEAIIKEKKYTPKKKYRPMYHISSPVGWLNSPGGFTYFKQYYHVFYQYYPYKGAWGSLHWGQAISDNLVDWMHFPPALLPKDPYDRHGCLAGSATIHNNFLTLFYTGNVLINNHTVQTQNIAISGDGLIFQKYLYNPIVKKPPPDVREFKNPKVWRFRSKWYMLVGSTTATQHGQLVLYTSTDMFHWKLNGTVARSFGDLGYLWESPDLFEIDGQHVLMFSVQGMQGDFYRFTNMYQTGYFVGYFNYQTLKFENMEISLSTFTELDFGHDFYAAQTIPTLDGRRLLIAWLGIRESDFVQSKGGSASMLTIVRELRLNAQGRLLMTPVAEMKELRKEILENAWYSPGEAFHAGAKSFELVVNGSTGYDDAALIFEWNGERQFSIHYSSERGRISVDRGGEDGIRKADWVSLDGLYWQIFVDSSSIELFCGDGEVVFTSRIYPQKTMTIRIGGEMQLHVVQYKLRRSVDYNEKFRHYLKNNFVPSYTMPFEDKSPEDANIKRKQNTKKRLVNAIDEFIEGASIRKISITV